MQPEKLNMFLLDEEGFPVSLLASPFPSAPLRDNESGEIVGEKVVTLRRPPEGSPRRLHFFNDVPRGDDQASPYLLMRERRRFSGFRVQDALVQSGSLRLRKGSMTYRRRAAPLIQSPYQMCFQMKNGAPVSQTFILRDFPEPTADRNLRPCFRVPRESLSDSHSSVPNKNPNKLSVNLWEEFLLGTGALKRGKCLVDDQNIMLERLRKFLEGILPRTSVNIVMFSLYFLVFFLSCLAYNNFMEILGYMLFHGHLKLHECAYDNNIELDFTGSYFQGPGYAWIRLMCQHCAEKENAKVFESHMRKMKREIMTARDKIS